MYVCGSHSLEMFKQYIRLIDCDLDDGGFAPLGHIKDITRFIKHPFCSKLSLGGKFHVRV